MTQEEDAAQAGPVGRLAATLGAAGELAILLMLLHVMAEIASGVLRGKGLEGTVEIVANVYMVAAAFLPVALVERQGGHLRVEVLVERLPRSARQACEALARVMTLGAAGVLAWMTTLKALEAMRVGERLEMSTWFIHVWPVRWLLAASFTVLTVVALARLWPGRKL